MKKITYLLVLFTAIAVAKGAFNKIDIAGKVKLSVPQEMTQLSSEQIEQQFGMVSPPLAVFQDGSSFAKLSINERIDSLSQATKIDYESVDAMTFNRDLQLEKQFYKATLSSWFKDPVFLQDTIKTINKKQVIVFELEGEIEGKNRQGESTLSKNYTYVQYFLLDNRRYTVTFNCPLRKKDYWKPLMETTMASIKVK